LRSVETLASGWRSLLLEKSRIRRSPDWRNFASFSEVIQQKDEVVQSLRKSKYVNVFKNLPTATFFEGKGVFNI
jgi:hypothetical protein